MQSTGHSSTQARSRTSTQGSAITYVTSVLHAWSARHGGGREARSSIPRADGCSGPGSTLLGTLLQGLPVGRDAKPEPFAPDQPNGRGRGQRAQTEQHHHPPLTLDDGER